MSAFFMAHAGGRPTKYDSKLCKDLILFFEQEPFYEVEVPHYYPKGEVKWVDFKRMPHRLPTVREWCKKVGIHHDTFYEWVDKYDEFSDAFTRAKELQKWFIIENGLNGLYNPSFAIFTAINVTDMKDKKSTEVTGENGSEIKIKIVDEKITQTDE